MILLPPLLLPSWHFILLWGDRTELMPIQHRVLMHWCAAPFLAWILGKMPSMTSSDLRSGEMRKGTCKP